MDIKKLIATNQKKMSETRNSISSLDIRIQNLEMEIKEIQRDADIKIHAKQCELLNYYSDKEELMKELVAVRQKIEDLKSQI
jgi:ferritin-like metal-binding protein YciE